MGSAFPSLGTVANADIRMLLTIKFSNCNSGVPRFGHQAFAAKASQYFRFTKGYLLISLVGYMGPITSNYIDMGDDDLHRGVRPFGGQTRVKSKWGSSDFDARRLRARLSLQRVYASTRRQPTRQFLPHVEQL